MSKHKKTNHQKNRSKNKKKYNESGYDLSQFVTFKVPVNEEHLENYTPVLLKKSHSK